MFCKIQTCEINLLYFYLQPRIKPKCVAIKVVQSAFNQHICSTDAKVKIFLQSKLNKIVEEKWILIVF